jgi:hypothetical protein
MRHLFMQTMAGECGSGGGGGGNAVRTLQSKQSVPYAHIGNTEPELPSSLSLQSLSKKNTLVSKQKKDAGGGEIASRKG